MDTPEIFDVAHIAATTLSRKYGPYVSYDDARQDAFVWLLEHPKRVEHAKFEDTGQVYIPQLVSEVLVALTPQAKRTKAEALGVSLRYQARYTREQVEVALASVWAEADEHPVVQPEEGGRQVRSDPTTRGNYQAMVIDVRQAMLEVCTKEEQRVLFVRYTMGVDGAREGGYHAATTRGEYPVVVRRAVGKIVDYLNDDLANYEVEDGPGSRHPISNATAQAVTGRNW